MLTLDNDIKELTELNRTGLTYLSFSPLMSDTVMPALRIRVDNVIADAGTKTYSVAFQMFLPYPAGCNTFELAIEASKELADESFKIIEELIKTGLVLHKDYNQKSGLDQKVFNGQSVTEHKVIALQTTVQLESKYDYECCNEGTYFDFTSYSNKPTWTPQ